MLGCVCRVSHVQAAATNAAFEASGYTFDFYSMLPFAHHFPPFAIIATFYKLFVK